MSLQATAVAMGWPQGSERRIGARHLGARVARRPSLRQRAKASADAFATFIREYCLVVLAFDAPRRLFDRKSVLAHRADPLLVRVHGSHRVAHARLQDGGLRVFQHAVGEPEQQRLVITGRLACGAIRQQQDRHAFDSRLLSQGRVQLRSRRIGQRRADEDHHRQTVQRTFARVRKYPSGSIRRDKRIGLPSGGTACP